MEYQGTGIVSKTSADSCVVSICIDGRTTQLPFKRPAFYFFGLRCEGNMDNILDEGSEVDVCYTISESGDPCIVAVWLGDKPDSFSDDECSDISSVGDTGAVYGVVGRVVAKDSDGLLVQADSYKASVVKDVVFRDGCRWDEDSMLDMDEEVTFDAVPCEPEDPAGPSYRATCAWVGQQPCVVDRFNLDAIEPDEDMELEILQRHEVYGTVVVIPNEVVALVEVEFESVLFKVMLFRNSFKPPCERIQDMVSVGDNLCMRLRYGHLFPDCRQWFVAKAAKDDACSVESDERSESDSSVASDTSLGDVVLYSKIPLTGTISQLSYDSACINYKNCKIFVRRDRFFLDREKGSVGDFMLYVSPNKNIVNFEAVPTKLPGFTHEATCAWVGDRPSMFTALPPSKLNPRPPRGQVFYGFVSDLWLPKMALVDIPGEAVTISIYVGNFSCKPKYRTDASDHEITNFVRLNDCVQFKLWKVNQNTVIGWDAQVTPFSKDDWVNANEGVFVSRGPCENLERNGLSFTEDEYGGDLLLCLESVDAKTGSTKSKHCSSSRRQNQETRAAISRAKKAAEKLGNATANSLRGGQHNELNASAGPSCGSLGAKAAGTMSHRKEKAARWKAMKAAEKLGNATANSLRGGQHNELNASAGPSCGSLGAKAAGTMSQGKERSWERAAKWKAMKASEKLVNATAKSSPGGKSKGAATSTAELVVEKSTHGNRVFWNSAEKRGRNNKTSRAALTNKIIEGVASLNISAKSASPGGKSAVHGNFEAGALRKGKAKGKDHTAESAGSMKKAVAQNAAKSVPQNPAVKKAAIKKPGAQSANWKSATGNATSKDAAAKDASARKANSRGRKAANLAESGAAKSSAAKNATAKSAAAKKTYHIESSAVNRANNILTATAHCESCKNAKVGENKTSPVKQEGACILS